MSVVDNPTVRVDEGQDPPATGVMHAFEDGRGPGWGPYAVCRPPVREHCRLADGGSCPSRESVLPEHLQKGAGLRSRDAERDGEPVDVEVGPDADADRVGWSEWGQPASLDSVVSEGGCKVGVVRVDFVARNEAFGQLARDIALHIASADPIGVNPEDVPAELLERERRIAEEQVAAEGKPENIRAKIVEGKLKKFVAERTLLEQPFVRNDKITVGELIKEASGKLGEVISVRRFARFQIGAA